MIQVEVVFAKPTDQTIRTLMVQEGSTVEDAILRTNFLHGVEEGSVEYGVWGKVVPKTHRLQEGDRVEIYRPLKLDPKAKRQLIIKKKALRKAGLMNKS